MFEGALGEVIDQLSTLPGIGPKGAQRIAFHLLTRPTPEVEDLADSIRELKNRIRFCETCGNLTEGEECGICANPARDHTLICVVEQAKDIYPLEKTRAFRGVYHVLGGAIDPINGVGPQQLRVRELLARIGAETSEVILATNPNIEGEATAAYLARTLAALEVKCTRLARGLPIGSDLEYADETTLAKALEGRTES